MISQLSTFPTRLSVNWRRQIARYRSLDFVLGGAYHGQNLGDIALRNGFLHEVRELGVDADFIPILSSDLGRIMTPGRLVLGGGAIVLPDVVVNLRNHFSRNPDRVAIYGADYADESLRGENRAFLREVPFVSCRSSLHAERVADRLGRSDVRVVPDLALHHRIPITHNHGKGGEKVAGINVVPFLTKWTKYGFEDNEYYPGGNAETRLQGRELAKRYRGVMRRIAEMFLDEGWQIVHLPFTPTDAVVARTVFKGLRMKHTHYSPSVRRMLSEFGQVNCVVSSRLHALVFGLISRKPVCPFFYSTKCEQMVASFQIEPSTCLRPSGLLDLNEDDAVKLLRSSALMLSHDQIEDVQTRLRESIRQCLLSLGISSSGT